MKKQIYLWMAVAAAGMAVLLTLWLLWRSTENTVTIGPSRQIDLTPAQIQSIRDIGQWEFLAVTDEELVDTTRRTLLSTDRLSRIYYGTMRIGVDMNNLREDWIKVSGDSVTLLLPPVGLLDDRFIDEARTLSFHESGRWKAQDREAMYQRARRRMLARGLSPQNLRSAEEHADAQFRQLLQALGFSHVIIRFER